MKYTITGNSTAHKEGTFTVKQNTISFGINGNESTVPNPAELLLGAFAACCLKNIERFSQLLKFDYDSASIEVVGDRQEKPTKIIKIKYLIYIKSGDPSLNINLLHKNIQRYGTIFNTLKASCEIVGAIKVVE